MRLLDGRRVKLDTRLRLSFPTYFCFVSRFYGSRFLSGVLLRVGVREIFGNCGRALEPRLSSLLTGRRHLRVSRWEDACGNGDCL